MMVSSSVVTSFLVFFSGFLARIEGVCPDDLPNSKTLDGQVELCYAFVPSTSADANDGVLKGRVEYDGEGWVAMALSLDASMPGSEGIIGLPDADTVMKYSTGFYVTPTPMPDDKQTLVAGSIIQEDGKTVLTFTKLLKEDGEIEIVEGTNKFLFAYGSGNAFTIHAKKGPFELKLIAPGGTPAPTFLPTISPSMSPTASASPTDKVPDSSDFLENELTPGYVQRYNVDKDAGTVSMELIYRGHAWIAIAFSTDVSMVGSEAVIGLPGANTVQKYHLSAKSKSGVWPMAADKQTLTGRSIKTENGVTTMTFTKLLKEPGEIEIFAGDNTFLWAYGSSPDLQYHAARSSFQLNLSPTPSPTHRPNPPTAPTKSPTMSPVGMAEAPPTVSPTTSPIMAETPPTKAPVMAADLPPTTSPIMVEVTESPVADGAFAIRGGSVLVGVVGVTAAAVATWIL